MNNRSDQPASDQDPNQDALHYAPRRARDTLRPRGPYPTRRASQDEVDPGRARRFPSGGIRPPPVESLPPPPEPARTFASIALLSLLGFVSVVATAVATFVVTLYLW